MSPVRYKVAVCVSAKMAGSIFAGEDIEFLKSFADINDLGALPGEMTREYMMQALPGAQACITCWGTPAFTSEMIEALPELRLVAHAAGAVRSLVPDNFWAAGKRITSNAPIIAEDVAQTTLALMLTSLKQLWAFNDMTAGGDWKGGESGVFETWRPNGLRVGLVGASNVARELIKLLAPFKCEILLSDPYLSAIEARELGAKMVDLNTLLSECQVVSLHAPANPDCRHMLNAGNIPLIRDGALLINTARGMLIDEEALVSELKSGRFTACIDVTDPEPPAPDHPFRTLKNVILTPHIAGGHTINGRHMLGANSIKEIYNYLVKGLIKYEVRPEMLGHMA